MTIEGSRGGQPVNLVLRKRDWVQTWPLWE